MTATMKCGRCYQSITTGAGEYSRDGELLCSQCLAVVRVADAEAIEVASKRRVRILVGVTVALCVSVPSVLFAVGAGRYVSKAMLVLGLGASGLSSFALRGLRVQEKHGAVEPFVRRLYWRAFWGLFGGGLALVILGALLGGRL